jgi:hypothetical protein
MKWLDRLREKTPAPNALAVTTVPKAPSVTVVTASPGGDQRFKRTVTPPPPDEVGGDPCPDCGAAEWWRWVDGSRVCRRGLIRGDHLGRLSDRALETAEDASTPESITEHGHNAAVSNEKQTQTRSVEFVDVYDLTIVTDFLSACSARDWPDITRRYDRRKHAEVYTFQVSAANALVGYLLTSATCFTSAVRAHIASNIVWRLEHGVAGGTYTAYQDPKAPSVLATQLPLFGTTNA